MSDPQEASPQAEGGRRTLKLAAAFACIYVFWGSTYLAIRFAVETIPPFTMAGVRFLIAGGILYAWLALRREARRPTPAHWRAAAVSGALFFLGGNGGVSWAEQRIPSGIAALIVTSVPLWIALIDRFRPGGKPPTLRTSLGIALGFIGVTLLIGLGRMDPLRFHTADALVLLVASISWAAGTIYTRHAPKPPSPLQSAAMQMLAGGALLCVVGAVQGEWLTLHLSAVTARSIASLGYLVVFGSLFGFSAYNWLIHATTPARVSTYAYVNPVIAVALGWGLAGELVSIRVLIAGAIIIVGVAMILAPAPTTR